MARPKLADLARRRYTRDSRGRFARSAGADIGAARKPRIVVHPRRPTPSRQAADDARTRLGRMFGSQLRAEGMNDPQVRQHLVDLASLPETHLRRMDGYFSGAAGGGIYMAADPRITQVARRPDLERAAERLGVDLDAQSGLAVSGHYRMLILTNSPSISVATAKHEFGHMVDYALGSPSLDDRYPIRRIVDEHRKHLADYYAQDGDAGYHETFAEGYALWHTHRDAPDRDLRIGAGLGLPTRTRRQRDRATEAGRTLGEFYESLL